MSEEDEPEDIEQNSAEEENRIGTPQALTAALYGYQSEQRDRQIYQQHSVIQCAQWSNQRATNLFYLFVWFFFFLKKKALINWSFYLENENVIEKKKKE